jgi:hypothetical protein
MSEPVLPESKRQVVIRTDPALYRSLKSKLALAGQCFIDLTNATAETVDLLIGPATFGSAPFAGKRISVTHAAP